MSSGWDYVAKLEAELANENAIVRRMNVEELDLKTRIRKLEAALRQSRPYVYNAEVADAADLEARHCVLSGIDALLPQSETSSAGEPRG